MTVVRDEVLAQISDPRLRVYVVWLPVLRSDGPEALPRATALLAGDSRVIQYWDPSSEIGRRFAPVLQLPPPMTAWDAYLLYPPQTRWESSPPAPAFWMHQLSFPPWSAAGRQFGNLRLDGRRFREQLLWLKPQASSLKPQASLNCGSAAKSRRANSPAANLGKAAAAIMAALSVERAGLGK